MSEQGVELMKLIVEYHKLNKQISDLLSDSDRIMGEYGWENNESGKSTNVVVFDMSKALYGPHKWCPNECFRFYKNETEYPTLMSFVSILLFDVNGCYKDFVEPLIVAGWADEKEGWYNWLIRYHPCMADRRDDGTIYEFTADNTPDTIRGVGGVKFKKLCTLGFPLVSINNSDDLKNKVIQPMIESIKTTRR